MIRFGQTVRNEKVKHKKTGTINLVQDDLEQMWPQTYMRTLVQLLLELNHFRSLIRTDYLDFTYEKHVEDFCFLFIVSWWSLLLANAHMSTLWWLDGLEWLHYGLKWMVSYCRICTVTRKCCFVLQKNKNFLPKKILIPSLISLRIKQERKKGVYHGLSL